MNILICGLGSIGQRHLKNLLTTFDKKQIRGVEPEFETAKSCGIKFGIKVMSKFDDNQLWKPNLIYICSPTHLHSAQTIQLANTGAAFFIEKPLAQNLNEVKRLYGLAGLKDRFIWVGCNMRFHPAVRVIHSYLNDQRVGKIFYVKSHFAHFLPNWRPGTDYRQTYSASVQLGGGILLDDVHQIDLILHLFGPVDRLVALCKNTGFLKIDVEEIVSIMIEHKRGMISEIHMDYLRGDKSRGLEIIGEKGSIVWLSTGKNPEKIQVTFFDTVSNNSEIIYKDNWADPNEMYLLQQEELFHTIKKGMASKSDVKHAAKVIEIVDLCRTSSKLGKFVNVG